MKRIFFKKKFKLKFKSIYRLLPLNIWVSFSFQKKKIKSSKKIFFLLNKKRFFSNVSLEKINYNQSIYENINLIEINKKENIYKNESDGNEKKHFYLKKLKPILKKKVYHFFFRNVQIFPYKNVLFTLKREKKKIQNFFIYPPFRKKDILWNDVFFLVLNSNENFLKRNIDFKNLVSLIIFAESSWILDNQYNKFWQRKIHGEKIFMPSNFILKLFSYQNYVNIKEFSKEKKKNAKKNKFLKEKKLKKISIMITNFFETKNFPIEWIENYSPLFSAFNDLSKTFSTYIEYMKKSLIRIKQNHERNNFRDIKKFMNIKTLEVSIKNTLKHKNLEILEKLNKYIEQLNNYIPFDLSRFLPSNKHERAKILETVKFTSPIRILEYFPGSNKKKIIICWKLPINKNLRSKIKNNSILLEQISKLPLFYSRKMLKRKIKKKNV